MKSYFPRQSFWVLSAIMIGISYFYSYHKILFLRPQSSHQWRQADCLSFTLNYYRNNTNFFEPEVLLQTENGSAKGIGEFPIIYFSVAQLWKIFGYQEFIFRLVNILIVFCGLFALFRVVEDMLQNSIWAIFSVLFIFSSPILVYYTNNFLADAPAFGLALIGWYFFYKFYKKNKTFILWISMSFFLIAGLIKISSAISFIAIFFVFFMDCIPFYRQANNEKLFKKPVLQVIPFVFVATLLGVWYSYSIYYNKINNSGLFLANIFPIWKLNMERIKEIFELLTTNLFPLYFNKYGFYGMLLLFIMLLINYKKINRFLLTITILIFIGIICYIILFYQAFDVHDYYLTNLVVLIPAIIITTLSFLKDNYPGWLQLKWLNVFAGIILGYFIFYCALQTKIRYPIHNTLNQYSFFFQKKDTDYWNWWYWHYSEHLQAFETITPYLRSVGIEPNDKVIVTTDPSPNSMLYLMGQKGFSDFFMGGTPLYQRIKRCTELEAKYLIISDTEVYKNDSITPYLEYKIGAYKNIDIYDLKQFQKNDTGHNHSSLQ